MHLTVAELAEKLGIQVEGNASSPVTGIAGIGEAASGDLTFCAHGKYADLVPRSAAAAVIVPTDFKGHSSAALLRSDDPYASFVQVLQFLRPRTARPAGIHPTALVASSVSIGKGVSVGPLCVVEEDVVLADEVTLAPGVFVGSKSRIGKGSYIFSNVTVREDVMLGERVIIHSGSVIGSDGFGYLSRENGHEKVPQVGSVIIEDDVEIGSNSAIDRGTLGATRIARGAKIDNLVHIGHNVTVGEDSMVIAQVGISGSTTIGNRTIIGGQAGVGGHITVGDGAMVGGQAAVTKSVPENARVSGYPAMDHNRARRLNAYYRKLPDLFAQLKRLEQRVRELEEEREEVL